MVTNPTEVHDGETAIEPTAEERAAFARLFTTCFTPVYRYVRSRVPIEAEAEDIAHQVFCRLWTRGVALDFNRPLLPLLLTLARFAVIDYWRHKRVESDFASQCLQVVELEGPPLALDDPEREFLRRELSDFVTQALDVLSPRQREVAVLRWCEQLSRAEIAQRLNLTQKTVAMHLSRAKEYLRKILPEMYDFE